ncbi:phosphate ABC transporter permease PstA [Egbenema bharatensis]|uniref:phosphate ABC transporter permease PstA n=1 Tax=Egbenema bharatensis TaxID=3463334 RepID=UPI003A86C3F8
MTTIQGPVEGSSKYDLERKQGSVKNLFGIFMTGLTVVFTLFILVPLFALVFDVARQGLPRLGLASFTQLPPPPGLTEGGFGNAILGTLIVLAVAAAIAVPIGVLAAIYLNEFGKGTKIAYWVRFGANVLTGVPAIIAGLFAYTVVVITMGRFSAFSGGVALAVVMLPIVMRTAEEGLLIVPQEVRQGSLAVGATNFQTISRIVVPAALPTIATAITLGLARAAGEAAPLLFTALNNNFWSTDLFRPIATLPVLIYFFSIIPFRPQQELAWAAALVLLGIVLSVSIIARVVTAKKQF